MSLGMSFARRRMMAAMKRGPKYVWAVYGVEYVLDSSKAKRGTGLLQISPTRYASNSFTYADGQYQLVNPVKVNGSGVKLNHYLVSVSLSSSSSATSGSKIYQVIYSSVQGSYGNAITWNEYGTDAVSVAKGSTELYRVESDTLDYPVDGEQDGLWYVLVEGEV